MYNRYVSHLSRSMVGTVGGGEIWVASLSGVAQHSAIDWKAFLGHLLQTRQHAMEWALVPVF